MSKTPVSILQEITVKASRSFPVYTELFTAGPCQSKFIIQVAWDKYKAKGEGNSKKEAKQNAAKELIQLIPLSLYILSSSSIKNSIVQGEVIRKSNSTSSNCTADLQKSVDSLDTSLSSASSKETFVNYVGLLQEYCTRMELQDPCYTHVNTIEPSHQPEFILCCSIASEYKEGIAYTKKNTKQIAAKKMWEYVKEISEDKISVNVNFLNEQMKALNLLTEEPKLNNEQHKAKVLETYSKVKEVPITLSKNLQMQDYHTIFIEFFKTIPYNDMVHLIGMKNCLSNNINGVINIIQNIMKVTISKITFKSFKNDLSIVGFRLTTTPILLQIGMSSNLEEAEKEAVHKILEYMVLFMK